MMKRVGCCVALLVLLGVGRLEAAITMVSAAHWAWAYDGETNIYDDEWSYDASLPLSASLSAMSEQSTSLTGLYRSDAQFRYDFLHTRGPSSDNYGSDAYSGGQDVFRVTVPTQFTISGTYFGRTLGWIMFSAGLHEIDTVDWNDSFQESFNDHYFVNFVWGEQKGNISNSGNGVATGVLLPGHQYEFVYDAYIWAGDPDNGYEADVSGMPASAHGSVLLAFEALQAVPEPSTLIVWSLLTVAVVGVGRWRCKRAA